MGVRSVALRTPPLSLCEGFDFVGGRYGSVYMETVGLLYRSDVSCEYVSNFN